LIVSCVSRMDSLASGILAATILHEQGHLDEGSDISNHKEMISFSDFSTVD
jgi:hypothetical protein